MRKILTFVLTLVILTPTLGFRGCSKTPDEAQRSIAAAVYDAHLAVEAAVYSAQAFNQALKADGSKRLSDDKYREVLRQLKNYDEIVQRLGTTIDGFPTIDSSNKAQLIAEVNKVVLQLQSIVAEGLISQINGSTQGQVSRWLIVGSTILAGIPISIGAVETPTPADKVLLSEDTVKRAQTQTERGGITDSDVVLITRLTTIASGFFAQIEAQRGKSLDELRRLRDGKYEALKALFA